MGPYLQGQGWEVDIVAPRADGCSDATIGEVPIHRVSGVRALRALATRRHWEAIIATTPPGWQALQGALVARLVGIPLIIDARDSWAAGEVSAGMYAQGSPKWLVVHTIEGMLYRLASGVTHVTPRGMDHMRTRFPVLRRRAFALVPNGIEPRLFHTEEARRTALRSSLGIGANQPVLCYNGTFGRRPDEQLYRILEAWVGQCDGHLLLVSFLDERTTGAFALFRDWVRKQGYEERVHIFMDVPHEQVCSYLVAADVGLNVENLGYDASWPIKTFEYAACGVVNACLCPRGDLSDLIDRHQLGRWTDDVETYPTMVVNLGTDLATLRRIGAHSAQVAASSFGRERANAQMLALLQEVTGRTAAVPQFHLEHGAPSW